MTILRLVLIFVLMETSCSHGLSKAKVFLEACRSTETPADIRQDIDGLKRVVGVDDCDAANQALSELVELELKFHTLNHLELIADFQKIESIKMTSLGDLSPLRSMPHLHKLDLNRESEALDFSVLAGIKSLRDLTLNFGLNSERLALMDQIPQLTSLTILNYSMDCPDRLAVPIHPQLRKLSIHISCFSHSHQALDLFNSDGAQLSLDELSVGGDPELSPDSFVHLTQLHKLSAFVPAQELNTIQWPQNLVGLFLNTGGIAPDLKPFSHLNHLQQLTLGGWVESLSGVERLTELREFNFSCSENCVLAPLLPLTQLERMSITPGAVPDPEVIGTLTNLTFLRIDSPIQQYFPFLSSLIKLKELHVGKGGTFAPDLLSLGPLSALVNLENFSLDCIHLGDISSFRDLPRIATVSLCTDAALDLTPLVSNANLRMLSLGFTGEPVMIDLSPIASSPNLQLLSLQGVPQLNFAPLKDAPNLRGIMLRPRMESVPLDLSAMKPIFDCHGTERPMRPPSLERICTRLQ